MFAAGDVVRSPFKQAITAVAQGVTATCSAYNHVKKGAGICFCESSRDAVVFRSDSKRLHYELNRKSPGMRIEDVGPLLEPPNKTAK